MKKYRVDSKTDNKVFFQSANGGRSINRLKYIPRGGIRL